MVMEKLLEDISQSTVKMQKQQSMHLNMVIIGGKGNLYQKVKKEILQREHQQFYSGWNNKQSSHKI